MKINSLQFCNTDTKWNLSKVEFNKLTLLVGASGVGKTQTLESILALKKIANGASVSGIKWIVNFSLLDGNNYIWEGEFESKGELRYFLIRDKEDFPNIVYEKLTLNGKLIIDRDNKEIKLEGIKIVKLAQDKSVINLLKEEDLVTPVFNGFQKVNFNEYYDSNFSDAKNVTDILTQNRLLKIYKTIGSIRESEESLFNKLFLAYNNAKSIFDEIKERFIDIFPFVTDIKIAPLDFENTNENVPNFLKEIPFIQIKEKNVDNWIHQLKISSGMYKTLMHLSEIYLSAEGTVFLIDEFENSLGINCIDELTDDLQNSLDRNLQLIVTSHHPYIINQINFKNWKLVTRNGNEVIINDVSDITDITKSKQEAFVQLIQLKQFNTGIDIE